MANGFFGIGIDHPKFYANVGSTLRAAYCYGASFVSMSGIDKNALRHGTNTTKTHLKTPVFMTEDLLENRPFDTQVVVVDLVDGAVPLQTFDHPSRAIFSPRFRRHA